jgi:hypothetical protein
VLFENFYKIASKAGVFFTILVAAIMLTGEVE